MLDFKLTKKHLPTLLFFVGILLASLWDIQLIFPLILVVILKIFKNSSGTFNLTYLDVGFLILLVSEVITTIYSSYIYNSLGSINHLVIIVSMYLLYKNSFQNGKNDFFGLLLFYFFSTILLVFTVKFFILFYNNITSEGFVELNDFKNLYTPLGFLNNIWASALLLFIPFNLIFLLQQEKKEDTVLIIINLLLTVFCIIVSFSRGIYISMFILVLFLNVFSIKYLKFKKIALYNIAALLMFSIAVLLVKDSFQTTISFNKTESQQRSTSGRITLWKHSLKLIKDKPIVGYGQGNYTLAKDKNPNIGEEIGFTYRTNNTYIQILIERGILGLLGFILFFIIIAIIVFKNLKASKNSKNEKLKIAIIFSAIIAILVRELTFSSIFENDFIYLLVFHLIFLLIPYDIKIKEFSFSKRQKISFLGFNLVLFSILFFVNAKRVLLVYNNNKFVESYEENDVDNSLKYIDKALKLAPKNILLNKYKAIALANSAFTMDISSKHPNLLYISDLNKDTLNMSLKNLHKVLENKPFDSRTMYNLGWVNFIAGDTKKANYYFNKAIELNPFVSQYHIGALFYSINNKDDKSIIIHLSKALRFSPDILESKFYVEFYKKYPILASEAKQIAIKELEKQIEIKATPILKARLARLLLNTNPTKALQLLKETTKLLPNMDRPWLYMAYLVSNTKDSLKAEKYFEHSLYFRKKDFLPKLYYGKFLEAKGMDEKAVLMYKNSIESYKLAMSHSYSLNKVLFKIKTIRNSFVPNDLTYFLKPQINASQVFNFFENYYATQQNPVLKEYYKKLSVKYENKIFKGNEVIK